MHLEKTGTPLAKEIWSNCYADNVGADTLAKAQEKHRLSKEYFASAKMQLRQFASNCSQFNAQLPSEGAAELRNLMNLGYEWDVASDCWRISLAAKAAKGKPKGRKRRRPADVGVLTKRRMLQRLARITDPIGYLQPTLLPVKLAIHEAWIATRTGTMNPYRLHSQNSGRKPQRLRSDYDRDSTPHRSLEDRLAGGPYLRGRVATIVETP